MIALTVVSFKAAATTGPSARFDELGGTIGRADSNQLVLPDPERTISRVHARVLYRNGGYVVVDNGSNPITVNGVVCGSGCEQILKPGDQIQIGDYVIAISDDLKTMSDDPFADLFGDGLAEAPVVARTVSPASLPSPSPVAASAPPPVLGLGIGGIPEDWDLFAPDPLPAQASANAQVGFDPFSPLVQVAPAENSLNDLFGLGGVATLSDPLGAIKPTPAGALRFDPLGGFGGPPMAVPPTSGDLGSELNTPMPLMPPSPARHGSGAAVPPSDAVFSWEGADGKEPPLTAPFAPTAPRAAVQVAAPTVASVTTAAGATANADGLLRALIDGLGVPDLRMDELSPQNMRLIGQLLHEATRGTVELLAARAALKREMHADVTMIMAKKNNPLKFSPTVDVALQHLLGAPTAGFMLPAPAMRDAFDDLRAHQLGVMAGMRAALEGVFQRFDPIQLEASMEKNSSISSLIPSTRKARLWDQFQALFAQLQSEAQEDFDELFGKAFLQAYKSHIARLRDEPGPK